MRSIFYSTFLIALALSCHTDQAENEKRTALKYCSTCHLFPDASLLPKEIWEHNILPQMALHLGHGNKAMNPFSSVSMEETIVMRASGFYPEEDLVSEEEWSRIREYYLSNAPDSLTRENYDSKEQKSFEYKRLRLDTTEIPLISMLYFERDSSNLFVGTAYKDLFSYCYTADSLALIHDMLPSAPVSMQIEGKDTLVLCIGQMAPNDRSEGVLYSLTQNKNVVEKLSRPVYIQEIEKQGAESLISEFGHHGGGLYLIGQDHKKKEIYRKPGTLKTILTDLNADGNPELLSLTGQGDESLISCVRMGDTWSCEPLLRFHPLTGVSDMEIADINGDGRKDILIASGDNADYSIVAKPYHGVYIYYNKGNMKFGDAQFLPMNGCTNIELLDYDLDGDIDIAAASFFPEEKHFESSLALFSNEGSNIFSRLSFKTLPSEYFLLMTQGDLDSDGDVDLILANFGIHPRKRSMESTAANYKSDLLLLINNTK